MRLRKLKLTFTDRLGIVADIATILSEHYINILSMEVHRGPEKGCVEVYLEIDNTDSLHEWIAVDTSLIEVHSLRDLTTVDTLPSEAEHQQLKVVLDSISDGILATDHQGVLTLMNTVAEEITGIQAEDGVGQAVEQLTLPENNLLACLHGETFERVPRNILHKDRRYQFLATTRPITNSDGQVVGAVEILKDLKRIRELAKAVVQSGPKAFVDIVGSSASLHPPIHLAQQVAPTDTPVCIRGESGTGKELFARAIHAESGRTGEFVALNCAALPENLIEAELFGYESGAFTGAGRRGKKGLVELAENGTLFLDEIAELPLTQQVKLLRVLQERRIRPIGGTSEVPINCRILTATSCNLEQMMVKGQFREDLFYRIHVLPIHLPPLRERLDDLPQLVDFFLFHFNSRLKKPAQELMPEAFDKLHNHHWPGNIRELRNVIERAAILSAQPKIGVDSILFSFELGRSGQSMAQNLAEVIGKQTLAKLVETYEKSLLREVLGLHQSLRKAARELGISHTTLMNKRKKYNL